MKDKTKYNDTWFADFETLTYDSIEYQQIKHTMVYLWYLKNKKGDKEQLGNTIEDFWEFLIKDKKNQLIYFHNLSFDGDFIFKFLLKNYPEYYITPLEEDKATPDRNWFNVFNNGNKYYSITFHRCEYIYNKDGSRIKKRWTIKFMCSYNLLSSSIDSLGKSLGLNKLQEIEKMIEKGKIKNKNEFYNLGGLNMDEEVREAYIKYIKNDVETARLSFINFENNLNKLKSLTYSEKFKKNIVNLKNNLTIGGLVYSLSKNHIYNTFGSKVLKKYKISSEAYDFARNWFYGGWTQFNPKYWDKYLKNLNGCVIDINSSYPYQMTKLLPVGELQKSINRKWKNYLVYYELEIESAKIKSQYENFVILKNWKKEDKLRYVKELNNFKCFYTKDEFEFLKKVYDFKISKVETWFCEGVYLLKDMINQLYEYKNYYASIGDDANKLTYKIMLNSLYGRQCKRKQYDVILYIEESDLEQFKEIKKAGNAIEINGKKFLVKTIKQNRLPILNWVGIGLHQLKDGGKYGNILIGAQITSYARLQLWNAIFDIGVDKFIYCDTDSIFLNTDEDLSKYIELDNLKLGAWDVECKFTEGKVLGAKRYAFIKADKKGIKFGMSGINNLKFDETDIDKIITNDNVLYDAQTFLERDDYGIVIKKRDFKIKRGGL